MISAAAGAREASAIPADLAARFVRDGLWAAGGVRQGVEAWAIETPHRAAVTDAEVVWDYRTLADNVACCVGALRHRGVAAGTTVLVVAPLSAAAVAAYLAVLRTGATAVMLDRRCGRLDLEAAVEGSEVALVVATDESAAGLDLPGLHLPVVSFEDLLAGVADHDWPEPDRGTRAAVVFTSGTSSRPKGVVHSLDTLRAGARNMAEALALSADDTAFLSSPLASITGLVQVDLTLERGAGLLLEDRFDRVGSLARLRTHGATVLGGAPVIVEELFKQAAAEDLDALPLRAIVLGGAMIPRDVLEIAVDRYGIVPVRMYGASEVPCASGTLQSDQGEARLAGDGAPFRGTEIRTDGEVPGEVLVRGPMRCLAYLDAVDEEGAFAADGWYRTGDLGVVVDGRLTITGRLKEVVSRKGLKISLPEVDAAARLLPGITEAAAYGVPDQETGERLVLAVLRDDPGLEVSFEELTSRLLSAGLTKWKLPEEIVLWDEPLPRTESGKVQRRLLSGAAEGRLSLLAPRLRPART